MSLNIYCDNIKIIIPLPSIYLDGVSNTSSEVVLLDIGPSYNYMDLERYLQIKFQYQPTMDRYEGGDNHPLALYLQDIQSKFHVNGWTEKWGFPSELSMREYCLLSNGNRKLELLNHERLR